ncbi:hypothetical protein K458DRAFT_76386 [Lentithecium fluviatile CBS 122367]|uniref:C2H2-type domain-containing protein n=1 Tax=Lentithecium fluviatile CBS 122367 TaxID=1168545 RepID=A0A6G1IU09_9PLEO|nr:hypothetical protein K458DRAFT_76386 [Lentithecium fluviatile CBS 122367]
MGSRFAWLQFPCILLRHVMQQRVDCCRSATAGQCVSHAPHAATTGPCGMAFRLAGHVGRHSCSEHSFGTGMRSFAEQPWCAYLSCRRDPAAALDMRSAKHNV